MQRKITIITAIYGMVVAFMLSFVYTLEKNYIHRLAVFFSFFELSHRIKDGLLEWSQHKKPEL